jgi:hypothetical protein
LRFGATFVIQITEPLLKTRTPLNNDVPVA